jgi:hypothetical protein
LRVGVKPLTCARPAFFCGGVSGEGGWGRQVAVGGGCGWRVRAAVAVGCGWWVRAAVAVGCGWRVRWRWRRRWVVQRCAGGTCSDVRVGCAGGGTGVGRWEARGHRGDANGCRARRPGGAAPRGWGTWACVRTHRRRRPQLALPVQHLVEQGLWHRGPMLGGHAGAAVAPLRLHVLRRQTGACSAPPREHDGTGVVPAQHTTRALDEVAIQCL